MTTNEIVEEIMVKSGVDVSSLPDRTLCTQLSAILKKMGGDPDSLPDNLLSTQLGAILECCGGSDDTVYTITIPAESAPCTLVWEDETGELKSIFKPNKQSATATTRNKTFVICTSYGAQSTIEGVKHTTYMNYAYDYMYSYTTYFNAHFCISTGSDVTVTVST